MAATVKHPSGGCWIIAVYDNEKLRQRSRLETTLNLLSPISHITKKFSLYERIFELLSNCECTTFAAFIYYSKSEQKQ